MLNLSAPRIFDLAIAGRHYRQTFRRITDADWRGYYERITSTQQRDGKDIINEFDNSTARVWLVEQTLSSIDGYALGGIDLATTQDWQKLVPLRHKLAAAEFLLTIGYKRTDSKDAIALSAEECVTLTLPLGWTCGDDGAVQPIGDLKHYFKSPSIEQQRKLRLAQSKSVLEDGGRSGKTRTVPAQPAAMELYDELLSRTEGYTWIASDASEKAVYAAEMDGLHKVAAVLELFNASRPEADEAR